MHGSAGNFYENRFIDHIADRTNGAGYAFLTGDNRGRDYFSDFLRQKNGELSSVRIGTAFEIFEECIHDIRGWIDFLVERGYRKVVLEGHSTGAIKVTYYQSVLQDKRVVGLILMSPSDDIALQQRDLRDRFHESVRIAEQMVKERHGRDFMPPRLYEYQISASTYLDFFGPKTAAGIFNFASKSNALGRLSRIKCPILAFYGTKDEALTINPQDALRLIRTAATSSPKCDTYTIEGSHHSYRGYETKVAQLIVRWLVKNAKQVEISG
jgi:pimeloyl-ACP methyl ester carboxylesterase